MAARLDIKDMDNCNNIYVDSRLALIKDYIKSRLYPIILGCFGFLVFVSLVVLFHRTAKINDKLSEIQEKDDKIDFLIRASSAKSCRELHQHGFTTNGYYQIDLDGRYRGLRSTKIYCDFTDIDPKMIMFTRMNGSIELTGSGNATFEVTYDTNLEDMKNVIKNSNYCSQEIIFECQKMPLHTKGNNHAAWFDNQGNPHYFFDGSNQLNLNDRQCACGASGSCQGNLLCNCDWYSHSNSHYWTKDQGKIEEKDLLPITQFSYFGSEGDSTSDNPGRAKLNIGNVICEKDVCPLGWSKLASGWGCERAKRGDRRSPRTAAEGGDRASSN